MMNTSDFKTSHEMAGSLVARILTQRISGLAVVVSRMEDGSAMLHGIYNCPCGEISQFKEVYRCQSSPDMVADKITRMLRQHVKGEGNEPNF